MGSVLSVLLSTRIFCDHSGQNLMRTHEAQNFDHGDKIMNITIDKSTDDAEPHSICFFTTIFNIKKKKNLSLTKIAT